MQKASLALVLIIIIAGIYYFVSKEDSLVEMTRYESGEHGFAFEYRAAPDGYLLQEPTFNPDFNENLLKIVTLFNKEEYESIINGERDGGEGPPAIDILIFDNPDNLSLAEWVEVYPQYSGIVLIMGVLEEVSFAGVPALSYQADGLYASRNLVFSKDGKIFLLTGQFLERGRGIYQDFDQILKSFELI